MGKIVSVILVLVVVALVGLGVYANGHTPAIPNTGGTASVASSDTSMAASSTATQVGYIIASSSPSNTVNYTAPKTNSQTNTQTTTKTTTKRTTTYTNTSNTASAYGTVYGNSYHNGVFGLTVPGTYTVTQGRNTFSDVSNTATLSFYRGGALNFTINVWSREEWSKLRNEETWNADQGNGAGTYFGEGTYLGENETWIYSLVPSPYAPTGVRFY